MAHVATLTVASMVRSLVLVISLFGLYAMILCQCVCCAEELIRPKHVQVEVQQHSEGIQKASAAALWRDLLVSWEASCRSVAYEDMVSVIPRAVCQ